MGSCSDLSDDEIGSFQSATTDVVHQWEDHVKAKPVKYDYSKGNRGIVHIFNNYKFTGTSKIVRGGEALGSRLFGIFSKQLNYKVRKHDNLTKAETDKMFETIYKTKGLADENAMIFFILSHGSGEFTFKSGDWKNIDLKEKMLMFRKDKCPGMKHKPIVWFADFCHGTGEQRGVAVKDKSTAAAAAPPGSHYGTDEVLSNTLYAMSSSPGIASLITSDGLAFTTEICKMLESKRYHLNDKWFMKLNARLRAAKKPSSVRYYYDPFPGQLFYDKGFYFNYDVAKIEKKKRK